MKKILKYALIVPILLLAANVSFAQEDEHKADREQFLQILSGIETSINEKRFEEVLDYLNDDVNVVYQNAEVADGKNAVLDFYNRMFTGEDALLKDISTKATVGAPAEFYGDTAVAYGSAIDTVTYSKGRVIDIPVVWTVTLHKENDEWKVVSLHLSINAFDNPILSKMSSMMIWIGFGALILGLAIGFLLARKRKTI